VPRLADHPKIQHIILSTCGLRSISIWTQGTSTNDNIINNSNSHTHSNGHCHIKRHTLHAHLYRSK